jgi:hypothetical protein
LCLRGLNNAYRQPITRGQDGGWSSCAFKNAFRGSSTAFLVGTGAFPNYHRKLGATGIENFKVAFNPAPGYFETDTFQTFSVDKTAVPVATQLERHDREVLMSKVLEVLCASASCRAIIDPNERNIWDQWLIYDRHR